MKQNFKTATFNDKSCDVIITISGDKNNAAIMIYKNICKIVIHENLFTPFYSAEIEYIDDSHALEKGSNLSSNNGGSPTNVGYRYRGDGHDVVTLQIYPHDDLIPTDSKDAINFNCTFCVVDTYRTYNPNLNRYTKTLILEDYSKWLLSERQSFYTTKSNVTYAALRSNSDRSMLTGHAIYELLSEQLGENNIDKNAWDIGSKYIYYSAGINEKAIDTLNNLLQLHNAQDSDTQDVCYLNHNVGSGLWSLVSTANMYKNAIIKPNKCGSLHIDRIYISSTDESAPQANSKYTPIDTMEDMRASNALSYDFKDIQSIDAMNLNSHIVYNYNTHNKEFILECKDGYIDNFRNNFYVNYAKKMIGKNDSAYPNIPLTQNKINNGTITNAFNLYEDVNVNFSKNQLLKYATLLNNGIELSTLGSTLRRPGLFISVDNKTSGLSNDFNSKIYGDYLIISSNHIFEGNKYITNMICTKPYVYNKPENEPKELING